MVDADAAADPEMSPWMVARENTLHVALSSAEQGVSAMRKQFRGGVGALVGAVAALLLLVCANIGGLMLARHEARRAEIAIRLSLGASRWAIVGRVLCDALVIAVPGAVLGCLVARWCGPLLMRFLPSRRPMAIELMPASRALALS